MTAKQIRMLEILENWGGMGTIEVETQWGGYDYGDSEFEEAKGFRVTRFVVRNIIRSLVRLGYATHDADGYGITEAGRAALEQHRYCTRKESV